MNLLKQLIKEEVGKVIREAKYPETAAEYADQLNQEAEARRTSPEDWIGKLSTDQSYWDKQGIHSGYELAHMLAVETYYNIYKDTYGIKPRHVDFKNMSVDEIEAAINNLEQE